MPDGQSFSINPDPYDQPWRATIGRRRTIDEGQPGVSNYTDDWKLSQPFNEDWRMALPDYGTETQKDPYSSTVQSARTKLGQMAKSTVGEFAGGAITDDAIGDLLRGTPVPKDQSGFRSAGQAAQVLAAIPAGAVRGGRAALGEAMTIGRNRLGIEGAEAGEMAAKLEKMGTGTLEHLIARGGQPDWAEVNRMVQRGEDTPALRNFIKQMDPKDLSVVEPAGRTTDAMDALRRRKFSESEANRVVRNANLGTRDEIANMSDLPANEHASLMDQIHQEARPASADSPSLQTPAWRFGGGAVDQPILDAADAVGGPLAQRLGASRVIPVNRPIGRPDARALAAARKELEHIGLPTENIDRVLPNVGAGTAEDIINIRGMGPTDEQDLMIKLGRREATPNRAPAIHIPGRTSATRVSPSGLILPGEPFKPTPGGMLSTNPLAWDNPEEIPGIQDLIGRFTVEALPPNVTGASPKRGLKNALGQLYMHKGTPYGGHGATLAEQIENSASGYGRLPVLREEAGSRLANLGNAGKTPMAVQVQEGGSLQPFLHNAPPRFSALATDPRYAGAGLTMDRPDIARQMLSEQVIDTLGQTDDLHAGQFMFDPHTGQVIASDKGQNELMTYLQHKPGYHVPSNSGVAQYSDTYGEFARGGKWNKYLDPEVYQQQVARLKGIPEHDYRRALTPLQRPHGGAFGTGASQSGMSDADFDTLMRNFMGEIDTLGPRFESFYNFNKP